MKKRVIYICLMLMTIIIPIITLVVHDNRIEVFVISAVTQIIWILIIIFLGLLRAKWFESSDKLDELIEEKEYQKNRYKKAVDFISARAYEKNICTNEELKKAIEI